MKKNPIIYILALVYSLPALASEDLSGALKVSHQMNYGSIIMSLVFVIILIYVTGIMYTKLNKFGLRTIKKEFNDFPEKAVIVSVTPIGNNKSLQVVEINGERLLLGVTQNSINLIKKLDNVAKKEYSQVKEQKKEDVIESQESLKKEIEKDIIDEESFGLYKKYLR